MDVKNENRLSRVYEDIATYSLYEEALTANPGEVGHLHLPLIRNIVQQHQRTIKCAETGEPLIASYYTNAPEIFTAMDLHWYHLVQWAFGGGVENPHTMEDLEGAEKMPAANDMCTLLRLALYYLDAGVLPMPTALVSLNEPCDGVIGLHEAMRHHPEWRHLPVFAPDPPYFEDERSIRYFADELKRMVEFLTKHTGRTLDINRLREVVTISNEQYSLWAEYNELRRAVPCPHSHNIGMGCFSLLQTARCGYPENTQWYKDAIEDAEMRIRENKPEVPDQKIRLLWFDVQPTWYMSLSSWLEMEWGAVTVLTMFGYCPYTTVDTSTEDSMFQGLAKRCLFDVPMIRQARGVADNFMADIARIVRDYKMDAVIWPGHMGHKDGAASGSLMRELCRDLNVPLLHIGLDLYDRRYTTIDQVKDSIAQFFTAMGLG
ncbi:MAG: 2-hydroxyacyl-CoA dehydratase [Dehalococcoidia bacterium]|nr:MAG: 2-hydroxyacyl-CoA dehydratase [Dehalococcoidia bacterium]